MTTVDIILAFYPLYLSIEYIRTPIDIEKMRHLLIFWVLWFTLSFSSSIVDTFLWWVPFSSVLNTLKIVILILAYQATIAKNIQTMFFYPIWDKFNSIVPPAIKKFLEILSRVFPSIQRFRIRINNFVKEFIGIVTTAEKVHHVSKHFIDTSVDPRKTEEIDQISINIPEETIIDKKEN